MSELEDDVAFDRERFGRSAGVFEIDEGWDVFAADGGKVGDVSEVHSDHIVVSKGFLFTKERYIPVSAIDQVADERVYLTATQAEIEQQDWDAAPATGIADQAFPALEGEQTGQRAAEPADRTVDNRRVPAGDRELDVPLRAEDVRIERRSAEAATTGGTRPGVAEEMTIEIPVEGEVPVVSKRVVVREEFDISKQVSERQEQLTGTVRREEVQVEGDDVTDERGTRPS